MTCRSGAFPVKKMLLWSATAFASAASAMAAFLERTAWMEIKDDTWKALLALTGDKGRLLNSEFDISHFLGVAIGEPAGWSPR
jgi:hypothetical protein